MYTYKIECRNTEFDSFRMGFSGCWFTESKGFVLYIDYDRITYIHLELWELHSFLYKGV